ncbi:MAG: 7-cyano-7-deazaguanine synthase QueC [Chloroflexi bacterium]|nr:7-cyano-7-deazaguanine synthase QueC [Chloroflexota bacterium]
MTTYGITLLSGGLDSTTVTTYAKSRVDSLTALTFHYGQTHSKEIQSAQKIAHMLGIRHELIDVSFFSKVAWYSALTSPDLFPMPKDRPLVEMGVSIPITYVPLRNTFFLTLATAFVESEALHSIEIEGQDPAQIKTIILLAPNALDYSGYPDCRPEYYDKISQALMYGSKMWTQYGIAVKIDTPIIHMSKAEIVRLGIKVGAPLELTWSCYEGGEVPCGGCDSCILRAKGFLEAGLADPLLVRLGKRNEQGTL